MSHIDTVHAAFEAFNRRDLDAVAAMCREDVEWTPPAELPGSRTYVGRDGVREAVNDMLGVFPTLHAEMVRLIDRGDRVIGLYRWRGTAAASGTSIDAFEVQASTIIDFGDDGLVYCARFWVDWQSALDEAGLTAADAGVD